MHSMCTGPNYQCTAKVPMQHRRAAFASVMTSLARLHGFRWVKGGTHEKSEHLDSAQFFQHQVHKYMKCMRLEVPESTRHIILMHTQ